LIRAVPVKQTMPVKIVLTRFAGLLPNVITAFTISRIPASMHRQNFPVSICKQVVKRTLILDIDPHRYLAFISDIRGQDINAYDGSPPSLIGRVAAWLRDMAGHDQLPGGIAIAREFDSFREALPDMCRERQLTLDELTFLDFKRLATAWIEVVV
jgi:hypothetical protein